MMSNQIRTIIFCTLIGDQLRLGEYLSKSHDWVVIVVQSGIALNSTCLHYSLYELIRGFHIL